MNPKRFLRIGGGTLITMGLLGVTGILGRISAATFFQPPPWINWFHLAFGMLISTVGACGGARLHAGFALGGAIVGTTIGIAGLLFGERAARRFDIPELADPSDHAAHLLVGLTALWGWLSRSASHR